MILRVQGLGISGLSTSELKTSILDTLLDTSVQQTVHAATGLDVFNSKFLEAGFFSCALKSKPLMEATTDFSGATSARQKLCEARLGSFEQERPALQRETARGVLLERLQRKTARGVSSHTVKVLPLTEAVTTASCLAMQARAWLLVTHGEGPVRDRLR